MITYNILNSFLGEKEMSSTNELLTKLARSIKKGNSNLYNLHFLKIINFLQEEFKIAAGSKAGSIEKGVDTEDSDLDIIFCIEKLTKENTDEIRNEICRELNKKYKKVECKNRSIQVVLSDKEHIDTVMKETASFKKEKKYIRFVKNINEERKNAIKLAKYWKHETNFKGRKLKSWQLEKYAIYAPGNSLEAIVKNTVSHSGGNPNAAITFLENRANSIND